MITYEWLEALNCSACNPAGAPGLLTGGVRVSAPPAVDLLLCEDCLGVLDSMAYVDHYERPHAPEALAALGVTECVHQTKVKVRRANRAASSQSLSHRSGLVVALKHLCQQWSARAAQMDAVALRSMFHREEARSASQWVADTMRFCATEASKLVQPNTRTAVISDYPKDALCAATNE